MLVAYLILLPLTLQLSHFGFVRHLFYICFANPNAKVCKVNEIHKKKVKKVHKKFTIKM